MLRFPCGEKKNLVKYQNFSKYYVHDLLQIFLFILITLLRASIVKNSYFFTRIYFIFLKKCPGRNLKVIRYQILTSVKILEKYNDGHNILKLLQSSLFTENEACVIISYRHGIYEFPHVLPDDLRLRILVN